MNKIYSLFGLLLIALFSLAGCSTDNNGSNEKYYPKGSLILNGELLQESPKFQLEDDEGSYVRLRWEEGDIIRLYTADKKYVADFSVIEIDADDPWKARFVSDTDITLGENTQYCAVAMSKGTAETLGDNHAYPTTNVLNEYTQDGNGNIEHIVPGTILDTAENITFSGGKFSSNFRFKADYALLTVTLPRPERVQGTIVPIRLMMTTDFGKGDATTKFYSVILNGFEDWPEAKPEAGQEGGITVNVPFPADLTASNIMFDVITKGVTNANYQINQQFTSTYTFKAGVRNLQTTGALGKFEKTYLSTLIAEPSIVLAMGGGTLTICDGDGTKNNPANPPITSFINTTLQDNWKNVNNETIAPIALSFPYITKFPDSDDGTGCYQGATIIKSVEAPSCTSIGNYAFASNTNLETVNLNRKFTTFGSYAFYECGKLNMIGAKDDNSTENTVEGGIYKGYYLGYLQTVGEYAFTNCVSLPYFRSSNDIVSIGDSAFRGCKGLKVVGRGFSPSNKTSTVTTTFDNYAFYGCASLTTFYGNQTETGSTPNDIVINYAAFYNCKALESFPLSPWVTSIGANGFQESGLTGVVNMPKCITLDSCPLKSI